MQCKLPSDDDCSTAWKATCNQTPLDGRPNRRPRRKQRTAGHRGSLSLHAHVRTQCAGAWIEEVNVGLGISQVFSSWAAHDSHPLPANCQKCYHDGLPSLTRVALHVAQHLLACVQCRPCRYVVAHSAGLHNCAKCRGELTCTPRFQSIHLVLTASTAATNRHWLCMQVAGSTARGV